MRLRFRLKAIPAIIYTALLVLVCISGPFHEAPSDVKPLIGPAPAAEVTLSCGTYPVETTELTAVIQSEDISKLDSLSYLTRADFSGSSCWKEIAEWGQAHPLLELKYTVTLPDGTVLDNSAAELDLSSLSHAAAAETAEALACLPAVTHINLGAHGTGSDALTASDLRAIHEACPHAELDYRLTLYGHEINLNDSALDFRGTEISDEAAALNEVLPLMLRCTYLDMDNTGVSNEAIAKIREEFPNIDVVWRVWFGTNYSVRTDTERILASKPTVGGMIYDASVLQYCTKVKYLDLGHNDELPSIDFVRNMPELEVLIIAMTAVRDISPLESCPKLEYLELNSTNIADISPLKNSTGLHHLNIAGCPNIKDISPLYGLTELERLWIGCDTPVPDKQVSAMKAAVPGCTINTTTDDPHGGAWRYTGYDPEIPKYYWVPRYELLRNQLGYNYQEYSFYWLDPLCDKEAPAQFKGRYGKEVYGK